MKREELLFERPPGLEATAPPEARGLARAEVRLLVSTPVGHRHARFRDLPDILRTGDLLVVNRSATLPASLPAGGKTGPFLLNLSTHYGRGLWLAEPRWSPAKPGPLPLDPGDGAIVAGVPVRFISQYPGLPRLWFVQAEGDLVAAMARAGRPIRYGYLAADYPLDFYQTIFASTPGSAEMPSAARPFSPRLLEALQARGVAVEGLVLHTGVSSLELERSEVEREPLYPEPFDVPEATAEPINRARRNGGRIIAVGTTVVRALESAWNGCGVIPMGGFTRVFVNPTRGVHAIDGLLTGFHDPVTTHLALLHALAGPDLVRSAYAEAIRGGYLWHEFGDSHLILLFPTA
jgi:S-adenosylmethionine:tRNA ribosyltransferase-isomerase